MVVSTVVQRLCSRHSPLIVVFWICLSQSCRAQDFIHYSRRSVGSRPRPSIRQISSRHQQRPPYYSPDYSEHFLDNDDWVEDKRSRLYSVDLKTRKPGRLSWTTRLAWTTIGTYILQIVYPQVTMMGIKLSDKILGGQELYRLITPVFLHGGLGHLFTNLYSLNNVGPSVETLFGPGRFLATYLVSGITGNLMSAVQSPNPALGASGAVFGIMGAYYVFLSRNEWLLGQYGRSITDQITSTIALNLLLGFFNPVIDNWGHLGGAIGGAAMAYYFGPRLYLADLPSGGRIVIDRPICRLPRSVEAFPDRVANRFRRMTRRMQVERYKADLPPKPWRRKGQGPSQQRRPTPNRSIKPKKF